MLVVWVAAIVIADFTCFGTDVVTHAIAQATSPLGGEFPYGCAVLKTIIMIYVLGGFDSALGGVIIGLHLFRLPAGGFLQRAQRHRLGGPRLYLPPAGVGMVAGTLFGGMILGLIATLINFNGSLNGAWIMISGGVLLFLFIVLQRSIVGSLTLSRTA